MSLCEGRGNCIQQCGCGCYDKNDILSEICTCGHRNHTTLNGGESVYEIYCKKDCPHNCKVVECHNYKLCRKKRPQNILDCHRGMCMDCAIMIGRIKFLDKMDNCPICLINKDMIEISCGKHTFCIECWKNWSERSEKSPLTCPLCRNSIWK